MNKLEKEYLDTIFKETPLPFKVLYFIGVSNIIVYNDEGFNSSWKYKIRLANWWNPLSYVCAIPIFIINMFMYGIKDSIQIMRYSFTYQ